MKKIKNVLSLFDGLSAGQLALNRIGIDFDNYYASEVDKYAISVTRYNFPNTIQLGDVSKIISKDLPKIDLLIGGSPCTDFSFSGKRKGMTTISNLEITNLESYLDLKEKGFEFEGQSYLFWEYIRLLRELKPKYFLLENVVMIQKWKKIITKAIGVEPVLINSALLSAQNRKRLYWTNIQGDTKTFTGYRISQPKDKGIVLKDILETNNKSDLFDGSLNDGKNGYKSKIKTGDDKSSTIFASQYKLARGIDIIDNIIDNRMTTNGKSFCITARYDGAVAWNSIEKKQRTMIGCIQVGKANIKGNDTIQTEKIIEKVKVRKYEVDISLLKQTLKESKKQSKLTIKEISEKLNIVKTKVEHWFRSDNSFAIPDSEIWLKLKTLLNIPDIFDKSILEWEIKDSTFDMNNRTYNEDGKSPTLLGINSPKVINNNLSDKIKPDTLLIGSSQKNAYIGTDKSSTLSASMGEGGGMTPYVRVQGAEPQLNIRKDEKK